MAEKDILSPLCPVTINKQHLMDLICSLNLVSRMLKGFVIEVTAPHRDITDGFCFTVDVPHMHTQLQLNSCIIYFKVISTGNGLSVNVPAVKRCNAKAFGCSDVTISA